MPWIVGAAALAATLFVGFASANAGCPCGSDAEAYTACQGFLDEQLGTPSEATITRLGVNQWQVRSYLTTKTVRGFEIRHGWTCFATYDELERWRGNASLVDRRGRPT